jgi:hypothetical protein
MIKSELIGRLATKSPDLYQRDIENAVDAILGVICRCAGETAWKSAASACSRSARVAPYWPQPALRRRRHGPNEILPLLQDRPGNAPASQSAAALIRIKAHSAPAGPASVIMMRVASMVRPAARIVSGAATARPSRIRSTSSCSVKPCARMKAPVQPCGPAASISRARRCSAPSPVFLTSTSEALA